MNFLDKLDFLMKEKNLNKNTLSQASGIAYTTIDGWYKKGYENAKLSGILKLANFFNVSLDYLIRNEITDKYYGKSNDFNIKYDEINHIKKYRNLDNHGKEAVNSILEVEHKRHIKNATPQPKPTPAPKVIEFDPEEVETITLKHSEYKASAGTGYILYDDCLEDDLKVVFNNLTRQADICIDVYGNSMEPKYHDKDILLVRKQPDVEIGEIGIFIIDDKGFVKKKGTEGLISINKDYDIIPKSEDIKCFGKVLGVLEKDWIV